MGLKSIIPTLVQFEITNKCNLHCLHCYHKDSLAIAKGEPDLPEETALQVMQRLLDYQVFTIILTGGDPLLRKNLLLKLVNMTRGHKVSLGVNTNLLALDDEILNSPIQNFLISCPSSNPSIYEKMTGGGDYNRFETNLIKLIEHGNRNFSINMVVNKTNLGDIRNTALRMKELGITHFAVTPMTIGNPIQEGEENNLLSVEELQTLVNEMIWVENNTGLHTDSVEVIPKCAIPDEILKMDYNFLRRRCSAAQGTIQVSNRGDVRACPSSDLKYGNILSEPLETIMERTAPWRDGSYLPDECKECSALEECMGGCRVQAHHCTNDRKGKDPWMTHKIDNYPARAVDGSARVQIYEDMQVSFQADRLNWRLENKEMDAYLVIDMYTQKEALVKGHMLDFIKNLVEEFPTGGTISEIAEHYNADIQSPGFQVVIKILISLGFVNYKEDAAATLNR